MVWAFADRRVLLMSAAPILTETQPLILHLGPLLRKMSDHEFFELCQLNQDLRIERTSEGDFIIMPPTGEKQVAAISS